MYTLYICIYSELHGSQEKATQLCIKVRQAKKVSETALRFQEQYASVRRLPLRMVKERHSFEAGAIISKFLRSDARRKIRARLSHLCQAVGAV